MRLNSLIVDEWETTNLNPAHVSATIPSPLGIWDSNTLQAPPSTRAPNTSVATIRRRSHRSGFNPQILDAHAFRSNLGSKMFTVRGDWFAIS